jgi:hypothetical protein
VHNLAREGKVRAVPADWRENELADKITEAESAVTMQVECDLVLRLLPREPTEVCSRHIVTVRLHCVVENPARNLLESRAVDVWLRPPYGSHHC